MALKFKEPMRQMDTVYHLLTATCATADFENFSFSADVPPFVFGRRYALTTLFKKLDNSSESSRLHDECEASYLLTEDRIRSVNSRIRTGLGSVNPDSRLKILLDKIGRKVLSVIGTEPNSRNFVEGCTWGPGATFSLKSVDSTLDNKLIEPKLSLSPRCGRYAVAYMANSFLWMRARIGDSVVGPCSPLKTEFAFGDWGRFSSVPKTTEKRRPIDVQPTLNLFFQKGAGRIIRRCLKREGIDLDDQSRNQRLAGAAYLHGLSTIDLEAASDSVSTELVRSVLPCKWFDLLDDLRTHMITLTDGSIHNLQKFSSMGNGFTFELESLIFYCLCHVVVRDLKGDMSSPIAVYGDDLIVSRRHYDDVVSALELIGFVVNKDKSFKDGFFFESCGSHYYKGVDVTPPYQREVCYTHDQWVRFANRLWRWAFRIGCGLWIDSAARPAFEYCSERADQAWAKQFSRKRPPKNKRKFIPLPRQPFWLEGDGGLIGQVSWTYDENGVTRVPLLSVSSRKQKGDDAALYSESLRGDKPLSAEPSYGFVSPRNSVRKHLSYRRVYRADTWEPLWS
jgi:hypothetical protein